MAVKIRFPSDDIKRAAKVAIFRSAVKMQELAKQKAPVDTGNLRNSIKIRPNRPALKITVIANTKYAKDIEFGTKPHDVNPSELKDWARRKLGNEDLAFPVAEGISRKGTKRQPFMMPALTEVRNVWLKRYLKEEMGRLK